MSTARVGTPLESILIKDYRWRDAWFDHEGHTVRSARINFSFTQRKVVLQPFKWRHRMLPGIRQVPAKLMLSKFSAILFDEAVYAHFLPAMWFHHAPFAFGQWLPLDSAALYPAADLAGEFEIVLTDQQQGRRFQLSLAALSVVSGVHLWRLEGERRPDD